MSFPPLFLSFPPLFLSFPRKRESRKHLFLLNRREIKNEFLFRLVITKKKKVNTGSPIKLGMTVGCFSGMTVVMSFPRKRESSKYLFFKQINRKWSGSPIKLGMTVEWFSGMTIVMSFPPPSCHSRESGNPVSICFF